MSFESLSMPLERRVATGQICNTKTCGCDTCPLKAFCKGPSKNCDAKFCSTRVKSSSGCRNCRAVCNKSEYKSGILSNIGNKITYDDIEWTPFEAELPDIMYQINSLVYGRYQQAYVINSKKLTYLDTKNWSPAKNLRHRFKIPTKSKVIISFFTNDSWMDNYAVDLKLLATEIKKFNPDYVFCPDFSVYDNFPRFDIMVNLRRRMLSMQYMQEEGLKVIPMLGWIRDEDFDRMVDWALKNKIKYGLINLQTISIPVHNPAWNLRLEQYKKIRQLLPDCELIVTGTSAENRLESMINAIGKFKIVDTKAFRLAEYHKDYEGNIYPKTIKTLDLFESNMRHLNTTYTRLVGNK